MSIRLQSMDRSHGSHSSKKSRCQTHYPAEEQDEEKKTIEWNITCLYL